MRSLISEFQNVPDIAHTGNARSPCCPDAGHRAETCHQSPSQQSHPIKDEQDCVLTIAYKLLPETSVKMTKALQIRLKQVQSGVVI